MNIKLVRVLVLTVLTFASFNVFSVERKSAIGIGFQYGGVFGWQGSLVEDKHRGSIGLGLIGLSVGYDYKLGEKISAGVTSFGLESAIGGFTAAGLRLHYYPSGTFQNGWAFGIDVFRTINTRIFSLDSSDENNSTGGFFSVGYGYK